MKITQVTYRSLRTGRGYNNTAVEATAAIEEGDNPETILAELRYWVDRHVDDTLKREDAYDALESIEARKTAAKAEVERLDKRCEVLRSVLRERHRLADLARANGLGGDALILDML